MWMPTLATDSPALREGGCLIQHGKSGRSELAVYIAGIDSSRMPYQRGDDVGMRLVCSERFELENIADAVLKRIESR